MSKEIVVNVAEEQTRIAIVEDGKLAELYIENAENKRTIGNMCLGRIRKVMPSIQAAFVDVGQEQDAFLHFSDLSDNLPYLIQFLDQNEPSVEKVSLPSEGIEEKNNANLLKRGQSLLVQITKEPISNKGSRISTDLSMAGRFIVLVPLQNYVAVSRKITEQKERRRLKALASSLVPEGFGVIVRTVAEGRDAKSLDKDLKLLMERWRRVERELAKNPKPPKLVHEDVDMASSIIRDQFSDEYDRILVDHKPLFHSIRSYVRAVAPKMVDRVSMHEGKRPVFEAADIQQGADRAFKDRVELPSGGYLFIEQTEAMHVIDVNSGRSGRGKSQAENSLHVNLEAARVIAQQIRLRDLGGIIVVDFIDLRGDKDRKKVYDELKDGFKDDRAVTKVLPMSDFGLVEITRQRLRPSITTTFSSANGSSRDGDEASRDLREAEREIQRLERQVQQRNREIERIKNESGDAKTSDADADELQSLREKVKRLEADAREAREKARKARQDAEREQQKRKEQRQRAEQEKQRLKSQAQTSQAQTSQAQASQAQESQAQDSQAQEIRARDARPAERPGRGDGEMHTAPSPDALVADIERWIAEHKNDQRAVTLRVHPFTAAFLNRPVPSFTTRWFMDYLVRVQLETDDALSPLAYHFVDTRSGKLLTEAE